MHPHNLVRSGLGAAVLLLCAAAAQAQAGALVTGTFQGPTAQTGAALGLRTVTVGGAAMCGELVFTPYDSAGRRVMRLLYGGVTYFPQPAKGWIRCSDNALFSYDPVALTVSAGMRLIPNGNASPDGTVYRLQGKLYESADGALPATDWTEQKSVPDQTSVDWGALPVGGIAALTYSGYNQIQNQGAALPARNALNVTGPETSCADQPANSRTDCTVSVGGTFTMDLENPTPADSGKFQWKAQHGLTLTRLSCSTDSGTVAINLETRGEQTSNTAGTSVLAAPLVCSPGTSTTASFSAAQVNALAPVALMITTTTGSPSIVRVHGEYQLN